MSILDPINDEARAKIINDTIAAHEQAEADRLGPMTDPVGFSPTSVSFADQTQEGNPTYQPGYYFNDAERDADNNDIDVKEGVDLNKPLKPGDYTEHKYGYTLDELQRANDPLRVVQQEPINLKTTTGDKEVIKDIPYYEGVRTKVYDDPVKGKAIPTIGVGFNLKNKSARSDLASVGLDLDDVLAGQELSNDQVHDLFQISVGRAEEDAKRAVSDFDSMPQEVQKILVNMSFQLGLPALQQFRPTLREMEEGNYSEAAARLEKTLWYKQSGRRSKDIVNDLRQLQAE